MYVESGAGEFGVPERRVSQPRLLLLGGQCLSADRQANQLAAL